MHYQNVRAAKFLDRPNRFIAHVELDGAVETVHVKNTGRCREPLIPDAPCIWKRERIPIGKPPMTRSLWKKGDPDQYGRAGPNRVFAEGPHPADFCRM